MCLLLENSDKLVDDVGFLDEDDFFMFELHLTTTVFPVHYPVPDLQLHRDQRILLPTSGTYCDHLALDRLFLFFFQAEDGIRDHCVTGVQTCALPISPALLHLTLYGPQEMTGAPQQYGLRLARLCRMLMDYHHNTGAGGAPNRSARSSTLPSSAIIKAEATVYFLQRSYRFVIDTNVLRLLPTPSSPTLVTQSPTPSSPPSQAASSIFDSSIEQSFAEAFHALANSDGADGWQLEREPEPLLLNPVVGETTSSTTLQGIFIPDFALTRGNRRIYVEILGFWTTSYRERKIAKLQHLMERGDLVLAIPVQAREGFTSLGANFPIVEYDGQLSATDLLKVLRSRYDDLAERLARIDVDSVRKRIENAGLLSERAWYELLHCYRRSELLRAAERVAGESIAFTPGVGLYRVDWLEQMRVSCVKWLGEDGGKSPGDSLREDGRREGEVGGKNPGDSLREDGRREGEDGGQSPADSLREDRRCAKVDR